ncbi:MULTISPECIES: ABC transporter ATP-binding protein [Holospora]|uniref:Macrolide export ATP-binding/permease protein MacB n=2 Tax=Holospora TaxID=44747 RepID=A0A061JI03_9PROT|nr:MULTISPECIES: ABC transporter ATP-binding protein [Holospora]ETZ05152.1 macrolide export ATP-binding/permease protein MacB [Holospora undulata HU1]GAJ46201.1 macrolide export ATP-binding/permease protein MacB [Holospora elegans E1]
MSVDLKSCIEFFDVSKSIQSGDQTQWILKNVNGTLHPGQIILLVGPSGCGKTTLLSILSGILSPTTGTVKVFGQDLGKLSEQQKTVFRRHHMGFIFQNYNLVPSLNVEQNVSIPLLAQGMRSELIALRVKKILSLLEMESFMQYYPEQLSGGQQQRIAIGRALIHEPRFILCDEPTAALDEASGKNVMMLLKNLASSSQRIILVVTHDNRIYSYGNCILEMKNGCIDSCVFSTKN